MCQTVSDEQHYPSTKTLRLESGVQEWKRELKWGNIGLESACIGPPERNCVAVCTAPVWMTRDGIKKVSCLVYGWLDVPLRIVAVGIKRGIMGMGMGMGMGLWCCCVCCVEGGYYY
jgi:hypothetical protein